MGLARRSRAAGLERDCRDGRLHIRHEPGAQTLLCGPPLTLGAQAQLDIRGITTTATAPLEPTESYRNTRSSRCQIGGETHPGVTDDEVRSALRQDPTASRATSRIAEGGAEQIPRRLYGQVAMEGQKSVAM